MQFAVKTINNLKWVPAYALHLLKTGTVPTTPQHLIIALADHFEPCYSGNPGVFRPISEQIRSVRDWCVRYPQVVNEWRDADGQPFKHTYFYPAEHYHPEVLEILAKHCQQGWGEVEVHLHHGMDGPDTTENTRKTLEAFRSRLVEHGCLSKLDNNATPQYAFVHGNWALANSANGRYCGVDEEMQVLADTGCYADFTLPSAPEPMQVAKVNSIYQCSLPLHRRSPHRRGHNLRVGTHSITPPIIVQGPLTLDFGRRRRAVPSIENGEISSSNPATLHRLKLWRRAAIGVRGRPDWCFIKLHCHGMIQRDESSMLGQLMTDFLRLLLETSRQTGTFEIHFVTAREMVNIILAACEGLSGNPGGFRDHRFKLITPPG